jgi:hypothetical protein
MNVFDLADCYIYVSAAAAVTVRTARFSGKEPRSIRAAMASVLH